MTVKEFITEHSKECNERVTKALMFMFNAILDSVITAESQSNVESYIEFFSKSAMAA